MNRTIEKLTWVYAAAHRRLACWVMNHARYVGLLWTAVSFCAFAYVRFIKPDAEPKVLKKFHEFADPYFVATVATGVVVVLGLWSVLLPKAGEKLRAGLGGEFSDTATNFAMISLMLFLWEGLSQGFQFANMLTPAIMIVAAIASSVPEEMPPGQPTAADLGVEFRMPNEDAKVGETTRVKGLARSDVPAGMELWLTRRWVGFEEKWYPLVKINLNRVIEGPGFEWSVPDAYIGGNCGKGEKRWLEVWIVGPIGRAVITQYFHGESVKDQSKISVGIYGRLDDMILMAKRRVERL